MLNYLTNREFVEQLHYPRKPIVATINVRINKYIRKDIKHAIKNKYPHLKSLKHTVISSLRELGLLINLTMFDEDIKYLTKIVNYYGFNLVNPNNYNKKVKLDLTEEDLEYLKYIQNLLFLNTYNAEYLIIENVLQFVIHYAWRTIIADDFNLQDCINYKLKKGE